MNLYLIRQRIERSNGAIYLWFYRVCGATWETEHTAGNYLHFEVSVIGSACIYGEIEKKIVSVVKKR